MRSESDVNSAIDVYADIIKRICLYHLKNTHDTEDLFQNIFIKYLMCDVEFENEEHKKAWFIRVSINACKDHLKYLFRHSTVSLEKISEQTANIESGNKEIIEAVLALPEKYRDAIYLHYYEGYSAAEIGNILKKKENTIYSLLSRGRTMLKDNLGGDILA